MSHADSLAVTLGYARSIYYANMRELYRTVIHPVIPGSFTLSRVQIVSYNLVDIVRKIDMCTAVIAKNFVKEYTFALFISIIFYFLLIKSLVVRRIFLSAQTRKIYSIFRASQLRELVFTKRYNILET